MNLERYSVAFCYAGDPNVAIYAHMRVCTSFCIGMNPGTDLKLINLSYRMVAGRLQFST